LHHLELSGFTKGLKHRSVVNVFLAIMPSYLIVDTLLIFAVAAICIAKVG